MARLTRPPLSGVRHVFHLVWGRGHLHWTAKKDRIHLVFTVDGYDPVVVEYSEILLASDPRSGGVWLCFAGAYTERPVAFFLDPGELTPIPSRRLREFMM